MQPNERFFIRLVALLGIIISLIIMNGMEAQNSIPAKENNVTPSVEPKEQSVFSWPQEIEKAPVAIRGKITSFEEKPRSTIFAVLTRKGELRSVEVKKFFDSPFTEAPEATCINFPKAELLLAAQVTFKLPAENNLYQTCFPTKEARQYFFRIDEYSSR